MQFHKFLVIFIALFFSAYSFSQIDNEANFYTAVSNSNFNKDLVTDYGVDNDFNTDDSAILQSAIDNISSNGGGVLTIPSGNYSLRDVNMKSNVHLDIDDDVVIRSFYEIPEDGSLKNYTIFKFGAKWSDPIENVSIYSSSGNNFKIDLTHNNNPRVVVFSCVKVTNFLIANCDIDDDYTVFSAVTTGGDEYNNAYVFPVNGVVKDIQINNAHYGYGVVQTQSAENILFKNLSGTGGATLRLETGYKGLNNLQGTNLSSGEKRVGGIDGIVARNISNTNGNSALMVSPHAMHNGTVDAEGIYSYGAGFAVRIEAGFVSNKYDQNIGLVDGTFEHVRVKNVNATYGEAAEIKSKHFYLYPSEISPPTREATYPDYNEPTIYIGASIAVVLADANYTCTNGLKTVVIEEPVVGTGFLYQEDIIPAEYLTIDCASLSVDKNEMNDNLVQVYPNPANNFIKFKNLKQKDEIVIYTISGQLIKTIKSKKPSKEINISGLSAGVYLIQIKHNQVSFTHKLIIQ